MDDFSHWLWLAWRLQAGGWCHHKSPEASFPGWDDTPTTGTKTHQKQLEFYVNVILENWLMCQIIRLPRYGKNNRVLCNFMILYSNDQFKFHFITSYLNLSPFPGCWVAALLCPEFVWAINHDSKQQVLKIGTGGSCSILLITALCNCICTTAKKAGCQEHVCFIVLAHHKI